MLSGPLEIYQDYQIVPLSILSDSVADAIQFFSCNFLKSIPYAWAHNEVFLTNFRPTETTRGTTRKFLINVAGQISNRCSDKRVLESENTIWRLGAIPKAYVCNWTGSVRVNLFCFLKKIRSFLENHTENLAGHSPDSIAVVPFSLVFILRQLK